MMKLFLIALLTAYASAKDSFIGSPAKNADPAKQAEIEGKLRGLQNAGLAGVKSGLESSTEGRKLQYGMMMGKGKGKGKGKGYGMGMMGGKGKGGSKGGMMGGKGYGYGGMGMMGGSYYDDYYYDDYYTQGYSGGMGMMGMMGGSKYSYDDYYYDDYYYDDIFSDLDDAIRTTSFEDDDCELVTFQEEFAIEVLTQSTDESGNATGSVFIFEPNFLQELDGEFINGTVVTGFCTRTIIPSSDSSAGGGLCQLTLIDTNGEFTIATQGFVENFGGSLAVTGGSGQLVSVIGDIDIFPVYETDDASDPFLDATVWEAYANFGMIVCHPQRLK